MCVSGPAQVRKMTLSVTLLLLLLLLVPVATGVTQSVCRECLFVTPGSSLLLPCLSSSSPQLEETTTMWTKNNSTVLPSHSLPHISITNHSLTISHVQMSDTGLYSCETEGWMQHTVKLSRKFFVQVTGGPDAEMVQLLKGMEGENLSLNCVPDYSSQPNLTHSPVWYKETEPSQQKLQAEDLWSLMLYNISVKDAGVYRCDWQAGNEQKSRRVEVRVTVAPTPPPPYCQGHTSPWEECPYPGQRSGLVSLEESLTEFSVDVYSHLSKRDPSSNVLFSPVSIAASLTHLLLGARGETRSSLESALRLPLAFSCVHDAMQNLRKVLEGNVEMHSQIYYSHDHPVNPSFANQSELFYGASPIRLTNDSELNVKLINHWVAEKTKNRITDLVKTFPPEASLALINTVYFNGKWKVMFEKPKQNAPFQTFTGDVINVPVLYSPKYKLVLFYSKPLEAQVGICFSPAAWVPPGFIRFLLCGCVHQVAAFPLSGDVKLLLLLPHTSTLEDLQKMEKNINANSLGKLLMDMQKVQPQMAEVTLPIIKLSLTTDLSQLLHTMNLGELFITPNLCGLSTEDVFVSEAKHRSFLWLSERGVEAAAATSLSFSRTISSFSALHPFVLILWSDQANGPVFMGRVTQPGSTGD